MVRPTIAKNFGNVVTLHKEVEPKRSTPLRKPNRELRTREYLSEAEVEQLITAAKDNRHGLRDATAILLAFRHGLRVSELCTLRWDSIDFTKATVFVRRAKNGVSAVHPLSGRLLRMLRPLQKRQTPRSEFVFTSERGSPISGEGFARMLTRTAANAGMQALRVHPHALRHGCGFALINQGTDVRTLQAWLGHASITHTVRYAALASGRFRGLWKD